MTELKNVLEKYPKSTTLLKEWWKRKTREAMEVANLSDEYKDFLKKEIKVENAQIERTIEGNPHTLFEFFDENGVYITVGAFLSDEITTFGCFIGKEGVCNEFDTRKEAERDIIDEAFEMLEEKL